MSKDSAKEASFAQFETVDGGERSPDSGFRVKEGNAQDDIVKRDVGILSKLRSSSSSPIRLRKKNRSPPNDPKHQTRMADALKEQLPEV